MSRLKSVHILKFISRGLATGLMIFTLFLILIAIRHKYEPIDMTSILITRSELLPLMQETLPVTSSQSRSSVSSPASKNVNSTYCSDTVPRTYHWQSGQYHIIFNYILASQTFSCDETVTYTTHADYTFLDNLDTLTSNWNGPISLSVYAPGTDFERTLQAIQYARYCYSSLVKELVSFHLIFIEHHQPSWKNIIGDRKKLLSKWKNPNCSNAFPWTDDHTYRKSRKLLYPVNVARNVARIAATTYFVFPSDIELYPNINVIPDFMELIRSNLSLLSRTPPKVFVFPIFEVKKGAEIPKNKSVLIQMLNAKDAILFHQYVCASCHRVPKMTEWIKANITDKLEVLHVGKRWKPYHSWEPIYIGTNFEPPYDERLSWEGMSDKMTQMFILCLLDYEFHILNNAFLVHRQGIKRYVHDKVRNKLAVQQRRFINQIIAPELKSIYGINKNCNL